MSALIIQYFALIVNGQKLKVKADLEEPHKAQGLYSFSRGRLIDLMIVLIKYMNIIMVLVTAGDMNAII